MSLESEVLGAPPNATIPRLLRLSRNRWMLAQILGGASKKLLAVNGSVCLQGTQCPFISAYASLHPNHFLFNLTHILYLYMQSLYLTEAAAAAAIEAERQVKVTPKRKVRNLWARPSQTLEKSATPK